jgi:hypothetical protein
MNVITSPSHLTDCAHSRDELARLKNDHGVEGIWYQVQNGGNNPIDYDLGIPRSAGLFAGVWGVTYAVNDSGNNPRRLTYEQQNEILGKQAVKLGADCVMVDAEDCLKSTRSTQGGQPMVAGIRSGGWTGPVHLTTLGAPSDPVVDDYEFDLKSFLDTGGGIFAQAYAQITSSYAPQPTKMYFVERMKVPLDKYNTMIWIDSRLAPESQLEYLRAASTGRAVSIFMTEYGSELDWFVLDPITKTGVQAPPVDDRLTLDPILVTLRDQANNSFMAATTKNPEQWAKDNPKEWKMLQNYLLYRVAFNKKPPPVEGYSRPNDPPTNCGTKIGQGIASQLMAGASLSGRLV